MTDLYVGPVDNICDPGQASTYTEDFGRHCVDLITRAPESVERLANTGMDADNPALLITAVLLILGGGILFAYNHVRNKKKW